MTEVAVAHKDAVENDENVGSKVNTALLAAQTAVKVDRAAENNNAPAGKVKAEYNSDDGSEDDDDDDDDDDGMVQTSHNGPGGRVGGKRKAGRRWSSTEDQVLKELVEKNGNRHWKRIAKEFAEKSGSERSDVQCLHRWNKCLKPGLLKGPWTPEEDETIKRMIEENGGHQHVRWSVIAKVLTGRLGKQVRERWINHLDPTINKGEWTTEEDDNLYNLQKRFGNRWKWIAELMPGRSENGVKNRWHSIKPILLARKEGLDPSAALAAPLPKKAGKDQALAATKSAAAAAVAVALNGAAGKKRKASSTEVVEKQAKKPKVAKKLTKKQQKLAEEEAARSPTSSLAHLLSIGQSLNEPVRGLDGSLLTVSTDFSSTSPDLTVVAERAQQLLRMSESYREIVSSFLGPNSSSSTSPPSPLFNEIIARDIQAALLKQISSGSLSGSISSPVPDPLLMSSYYNLFTQNLAQIATPTPGSISPTQLLAAAAALHQNAPPSEEKK